MNHRYTLAHSHSHLILIMLGVLLGAMIVGVVMYYPRAQEAVATPAMAQGLNSFEDACVQVAAKTMPAVVTIEVETIVPSAPSINPRDLFNQPFQLPPYLQPPGEGNQDNNGGSGGSPGSKPVPERVPSLGSGWIYDAEGYIVTNSHVVAGAKTIKVRLHDVENDIRMYPAEVVGSDPKTELAVIKIKAPRKLPTLQLGDSDGLKIGQWVMAVGAPFEYEQTVTAGIVSAKGRELRGESRNVQLGDIIQTDASINPGNSGGPLMDLHGNVIGINVAIAAAGAVKASVGIGFAIPAATAKDIIPQLIRSKKITRGWLGISIAGMDEYERDWYSAPDGGALVEEIQPGGPAVSSDLRAEDVIVGVNGTKVRDTYELQKVIGMTPPGTRVELDVIRDGKQMKVALVLGELPGKYSGNEGGSPNQPNQETVTPEEAPEASALGVTVSSAVPAEALKSGGPHGVIVTSVARDSVAAGRLESGIVIIRVNRTEINSLADFKTAMAAAEKSGQKYIMLRVKVQMDGEWATRSATIPLD